jgi:hypothetical protein
MKYEHKQMKTVRKVRTFISLQRIVIILSLVFNNINQVLQFALHNGVC